MTLCLRNRPDVFGSSQGQYVNALRGPDKRRRTPAADAAKTDRLGMRRQLEQVVVGQLTCFETAPSMVRRQAFGDVCLRNSVSTGAFTRPPCSSPGMRPMNRAALQRYPASCSQTNRAETACLLFRRRRVA